MIKEIHLNQKNILVDNVDSSSGLHISGFWFGSGSNKSWAKISGQSTPKENSSSISGLPQKAEDLRISGNKA